jgi:hypothetical protein
MEYVLGNLEAAGLDHLALLNYVKTWDKDKLDKDAKVMVNGFLQ